MKNVLVTGGAGFIGSNFVRSLLAVRSDLHVITLYALTYNGSLENLWGLPSEDRHTFIQGDICDRELVEGLLRHHGIDTLVHFAAENHVDRSILGPAPFVQTNLVGTFSLLEAAREVWGDDGGFAGRRFHHVSTDGVYGALGPDEPAFRETTLSTRVRPSRPQRPAAITWPAPISTPMACRRRSPTAPITTGLTSSRRS
jgi:dTDP-glucose 4,6-dehydratase